MKKFWLLFAALVFGVVAWNVAGPRHTPSGQAPLLSLSNSNINELQTAFNNAADRPRLLLLLSPT